MKIAFYPFFEREKKMKKIQFSDLIDNRYSYTLYMGQDGEDNSAQRKRRMAAIKQIISELKPDYQKLIRLYYFDGFKNFKEYNSINSTKHREMYNSFIINEMSKKFKKYGW